MNNMKPEDLDSWRADNRDMICEKITRQIHPYLELRAELTDCGCRGCRAQVSIDTVTGVALALSQTLAVMIAELRSKDGSYDALALREAHGAVEPIIRLLQSKLTALITEEVRFSSVFRTKEGEEDN